MIYFCAFIGSMIFIAIKLKIEKQKSDDNPRYHNRWKKYFQKQWDDFLFSIGIGQALVFFQASIFFGYTNWAEWEHLKAVEFYDASLYGIAGCMGLFGSPLILLLFRWVVKKAGKLTE